MTKHLGSLSIARFTDSHGPSVNLTKREYSLLLMDVIDVGVIPETEDIANQLRHGCSLRVTPQLMREVTEFADRDQDPAERLAYRRLLRKCRAAIEKEENDD